MTQKRQYQWFISQKSILNYKISLSNRPKKGLSSISLSFIPESIKVLLLLRMSSGYLTTFRRRRLEPLATVSPETAATAPAPTTSSTRLRTPSSVTVGVSSTELSVVMISKVWDVVPWGSQPTPSVRLRSTGALAGLSRALLWLGIVRHRDRKTHRFDLSGDVCLLFRSSSFLVLIRQTLV